MNAEIAYIEPNEFRGAENADWITESSHKNWVYSTKWNVTEFGTFWMDKSSRLYTLQYYKLKKKNSQ